MKKMIFLLVVIFSLLPALFFGQGNEYANASSLKPDIEKGGQIYAELCISCHGPTGLGDEGGTYPRLAGQLASAVIKQFADIRSLQRDSMTMYPFTDPSMISDVAEEIFEEPRDAAQVLADIAAYLPTMGKMNTKPTVTGDGKNLDKGRSLYEKDCAACHGAKGEGNSEKVYPMISGQNFKYMVRQFKDIIDDKRKNANQEMADKIKKYSEDDINAVLDFASRL